MQKDNKTRPCTCAFRQQLHCVRFQMGECDQKPIPHTFDHPNARFGRITRPAPLAKKNDAAGTTLIYVPLLDEGTEVIRPTFGLSLGAYVYRVLATPEYDPSDEHWKFPPGSVVRCALEMRSGGEALVAQELIAGY
ncbi:hypothetical protein ABIC09_002769 [Bradyrhizobium sp. S3.12.5]|uniref:hypothetical protein n=1 Tax=Bradyrhizobium sp. S3.12.5 TaxID=3156386 RepID=UPI003398A79D